MVQFNSRGNGCLAKIVPKRVLAAEPRTRASSQPTLRIHLEVITMAEMVRVNTRIGYDANAWLDAESDRTGVPKSTLIHLAIEQYIQQKEAMKNANDLGQLVGLIERLEKKLQE